MKKTLLFLVFLFVYSFQSFGQQGEHKNSINRKKIYFQWGYNRSWYQHSNLHLKGPGYEFELRNLRASDRPTSAFELFSTYLNPTKISIPQFNFRIGFYVKPRLSISIGWDHMKYVMVQNQVVQIRGDISSKALNPAVNTEKFARHYDENSQIIVTQDLLIFEHTDGFNYAPLEMDYHIPLITSTDCFLSLDYFIGLGAGPVIPRSDVRLFGIGLNNKWNLAGYGLSIRNGIQLNLSRHIYLEANFKAGRTNLNRILTTGRNEDKAWQKISFFETNLSFGIRFGNRFKD